MSREWKRGDVAIMRRENGNETRGIWTGSSWACPAGGAWSQLDDSSARPLLVLDPEDADQMRALWNACLGAYESGAEGMTDGIRALSNPAPPKPEEPTGLGAVVEDADGERWVKWRLDHREDRKWRGPGTAGDYRRWDSVPAVRVLSEGVQ